MATPTMDVIIELQAPDPDEVPTDHFDLVSAPVIEAIHVAGGSVLAQAWINYTIRARVPEDQIEALHALDEVSGIGLARSIQPE